MKKSVLLIPSLILACAGTGAATPEGKLVANAYPVPGGTWKETTYIGDILKNYAAKGQSYVNNPEVAYTTTPGCDARTQYCPADYWMGGNSTGKTRTGIVKISPRGLIAIDSGGAPGNDFVVLGGIIDYIDYDRSPGFFAPGAIGVASCQTAPATISTAEAFWTNQSNSASSSQSWEETVKIGDKYTNSISAGLDFGGIGSFGYDNSWEHATENAKTNGVTVSNTWTDSRTYVGTTTVGTSIPAGTIGTPSLTTPRVHYYGLFKMGRLFKDGGESAPTRAVFNSATNDIRYKLHTDTSIGKTRANGNTPWWQGRISVPTSYLKAGTIGSSAQNPHWYVSAPTMSVFQYRLYCNGDMASPNYAPAMKPALCRAGIDKFRTCFGF